MTTPRPRRWRYVEERHDADLGRSWQVLWDSVEQCYTVETDGDLLDNFITLHEARAAIRADQRAYMED
jgi:hypothetical protein